MQLSGGSDQLFRAAQGVTAGFEVAAGATALFGGQSEELEKTLLKVQGAMVFSQGLKDLKEFGPALKATDFKGHTGMGQVFTIGKIGIGCIRDRCIDCSIHYLQRFSANLA